MNRNRSLDEYRQTKDTVYQVPKYDPQTGEINPYYKELTGMDVNQTQLDFYPEMQTDVDFVNEVEEFNRTFGKPNNYEPTIPEKKEWQFVYDFILEELEEYRQACENGDIVEVLDALCDIAYVSFGNGTMLHGLKDKIWPAYQEVQESNMSKSCLTEKEAMETVTLRAKEQAEPCHFEQVGTRFVVYRTRDRKVMKSINYFRPNLTKFFTQKELDNV
tara:strand:- start:2639 stop:3289 length:651 start_codon:yes stop_codon:yes gene_type:complete